MQLRRQQQQQQPNRDNRFSANPLALNAVLTSAVGNWANYAA